MNMCRRLRGLLLACALVWPASASAQPQNTQYERNPLTLDEALDLARARAPGVLAARARIDIAQGRVAGASVWQPFNPELEVAAGPRQGAAGTSLDMEIGLSQRIELGGRRQARIAAARAGVDQARFEAESITRRLLRDVAVAFHQVLHADQRLQVAGESEALAHDLLRVAEQRHQVGDAGSLDVHAARVAHARARARTAQIVAERIRAAGELRLLLGLAADAPLLIRGELAAPGRYQLDALLAGAADRPALRALEAGIRQAEAQVDLGQAHAWPDLGLSLRYGREEDASVAMGGLRLGLPIFERGQELRATGSARARALRIEREAARNAIVTEIRTAFERYQALTKATGELEAQALPSLAESATIARKSYEAGNIAMGELLVLQRELMDARMAHIDLLLEAALAGIELRARAGLLQ